MKKSDGIIGLLFAAVGLLFFIPSLKMGAGIAENGGVPGAGFFPALVSGLIVVLGLSISINGFRAEGKFDFLTFDEEQKENIKPLILTPLAMVGMFVIWRATFFELGVLCFCLFMNWVYKRSWKFNIAFSTIFVLLIHFVFVVGLRVQFSM